MSGVRFVSSAPEPNGDGARVSSLPGIRYAPERLSGGALDTVCAPPYDVIDPTSALHCSARDPHNSVRLILPDSYDGGRRRASHEWRADGVLATDDAPTFSVYRMDFTERCRRARAHAPPA